ncbi:LPXTG cell wall anchor domain-containing protein [Clostridium sardiniense]
MTSTGREDTALFLIIGIMIIRLGTILIIKRNKKVN